MPATPFTWPGRPACLPCPTSRATRVTSEANEPSWSTIVLTTLPVRRNSPRSGRPSISSSMVWDRSPLATAPITRATSVVGCTRSPISVLTESTQSPQETARRGKLARSPIWPSLPTTWHSRSNSWVMRLVQLDHVVEGLGDFARDAGQIEGQADREIPLAKRAQGFEQQLGIKLRRGVDLWHAVPVTNKPDAKPAPLNSRRLSRPVSGHHDRRRLIITQRNRRFQSDWRTYQQDPGIVSE